MAHVSLAYRADMMLAFFTAALLGRAENPGTPAPASVDPRQIVPQTKEETVLLLRVLTPLAKARTAKTSIAGLQECMECLGGLGYLENDDSPELNVARMFRDANVLSIWEGTTDIMGTDVVKVLKGKGGAAVVNVLDGWIRQSIGGGRAGKLLETESRVVKDQWLELRATLENGGKDQLVADGRAVLQRLGDVVCATLLLADASRDRDELTVAMCTRFVRERLGGESEEERSRARWDVRMAFDEPDAEKIKSRL